MTPESKAQVYGRTSVISAATKKKRVFADTGSGVRTSQTRICGRLSVISKRTEWTDEFRSTARSPCSDAAKAVNVHPEALSDHEETSPVCVERCVLQCVETVV